MDRGRGLPAANTNRDDGVTGPRSRADALGPFAVAVFAVVSVAIGRDGISGSGAALSDLSYASPVWTYLSVAAIMLAIWGVLVGGAYPYRVVLADHPSRAQVCVLLCLVTAQELAGILAAVAFDRLHPIAQLAVGTLLTAAVIAMPLWVTAAVVNGYSVVFDAPLFRGDIS
jgi:hypothetical protein